MIKNLIFVSALSMISASAFSAQPESTPALVAKGKSVYTLNCVACHGDKGEGNGPAAAALNPKPRNLVTEKFKAGGTAADVFKTLSEGLKGTVMPPYAQLSEDDRWALTYYVLSLRK